MQTSSDVRGVGVRAQIEAHAPSVSDAHGMVRCVRLDDQGLPRETFFGTCSTLDDGGVLVDTDRPIRTGERIFVAFELAGHASIYSFLARRSSAVMRAGTAPAYRLLLDLDEDAGMDFDALVGDRLPDLF